MEHMEIKKIKDKTIGLIGKKEGIVVNPEGRGAEAAAGYRVALLTEKTEELPIYEGKTVWVAGPGEYEVGGIEIEGYRSGEGTVYAVGIDRLRVGVIGKINEELTEKKVDKIDELDVLIFDVGLGISFKAVVALAKKLGVNYLMPLVGQGEEGKLKEFLDEVDEEGRERAGSIKIDREELPEGMEGVVL